MKDLVFVVGQFNTMRHHPLITTIKRSAVIAAVLITGCGRTVTNPLDPVPDVIASIATSSEETQGSKADDGLENNVDVASSTAMEDAPLKIPKFQSGLDEMFLFFPSKFPDGEWKPRDLTFEDVWMTAEDGTRIHGWYCPCDDPRAVVLFAHGNAGNLSHRAEIMSVFQHQLNVSTLIFDYRGYGRSEGKPTVDGAISDAHAASAFLAKRAGVDESELVLMGRSLGGAIVAQVASNTQPRGLVLESTFPSMKQVAAIHYPKLAWLVPADKLDSKSAIAKYRGPLLQSHGTSDQTIPYELGVDLFGAADPPKQFVEIKGADHNDPQPRSYYQELSKFLDRLSDE